MGIIFLLVTGYLLGSVSFSYLICKKIAGVDIREHGSKNAGATNTLRLLGTGPAVLVLLLDALKGIIPVLIAISFTTEPLWIVLTGIAAIIGHNWPLFFKFRGGKGVATTIGTVATLAFLPSLLSGIIAILSIAFLRYVSLGSLLFITLLPFFMYGFGYELEYITGAVAIALLSYWRHRTNIVRLIQGEESKLGGKA